VLKEENERIEQNKRKEEKDPMGSSFWTFHSSLLFQTSYLTSHEWHAASSKGIAR
jgi:hypothetical protein